MRKARMIASVVAGLCLVSALWLFSRGTWVTATVFVAYTPIQPGAPAMSDDAIALRNQVAQTLGDAADGVNVTLVSNSLHRLVIITKPDQTIETVTQRIDEAISALSDAQRQTYRLQLQEMDVQLTLHRQNVLQRKLEIDTTAWLTDPTLMILQQRVTAVEIQIRLVKEELAAVTPEYRTTQGMISPQFNPIPYLLIAALVLGSFAYFGVKRHD